MINPEQPDYSNAPASPSRPVYPYQPRSADGAPVVSVITPYFNTDETFLETARSLLNQSFQSWEWVIVDDGSTDTQSLGRLHSVSSRDGRILVVRQDNSGPAAARNTAFRNSTGRYICLLDSDDMLEPTFIEKCIWFLESYTNFGFCNSWSVNFGDEEFLWQVGFERGKAYLKANSAPPLSVIRRSAYEASGGFDEAIRLGHEDWDFWLAMAKAGQWGHTLPEYLEWYRKRNNGRFAQVMTTEGVHDEFEAMVARKYVGLESRFPTPQLSLPEPFESVSAALPFENLLAKETGVRRALFLVPWMVTGGADRVNLDWIELLRDNGYQVSVCATLESHHNWLHKFEQLSPDIFILPNFLRLVDQPRFLLYLIRSRQIDTVLITGSTLGYQSLPFLRANCPGVSFVDLCHVEEPDWLNGGHPRFGVGYQGMLDLNIVTTAHLRAWMADRGSDPERIEVCYSGIDTGMLERSPSAHVPIRTALSIPEGLPVITFAGRICEQKRPRFLAEILRELSRRGEKYQALVIGDGDLKPVLQKLVEDYGLRDRVSFLGTIDHGKWLEALTISDIFLLPSQYEGISVALLEAMAMGVVPVVAEVGGQAEVVSPETGFLVPHGARELEDYVSILAGLIDEGTRCRAMGQAASGRIQAQFSRRATITTLLRILERARQLSATAPRPLPARAFAQELATQAVEYARLTNVSNILWNHWLQTRQDSPAPHALPLGGLARLLAALAGTRVGAALLGNRLLRRFGRWLLDRLEARGHGVTASVRK